jgi:hypothetical protein
MVQYEEALLEVYRWVLVEIVHDAKLEGQLDGQDRRQSFHTDGVGPVQAAA